MSTKMKTNSQNQELRAELRAEGASVREAEELAALAGRLAVLATGPAAVAPGRLRGLGAYLAATTAGGLVIASLALGLVAVSLNTIPGQPLHGLKTVSETVATDLVPALHTDVMMDKSWEVEQLVSQHKASGQVLATLADYNRQYMLADGGRYAARDYCSKELQQASRESSGTEQAAINASLARVESRS